MIALGCDHAGYKLKEDIKKYLDEIGVEYKDFGTYSTERADHPIFAEKVAKSIQSKECDKGILICTTGSGMAIDANKFKGIRCALCIDESSAKQAKEHLNANIIALNTGANNPKRVAGYLKLSDVIKMIRTWIASEFLGGRYLERLQMIEKIEQENMK